MANAWEELENRCYEYLKQLYGKYHLIEPYGKSDSIKADIKIESLKNEEFFIEVKASQSQCCQFVLFPNEETKKFDFSKANKVPLSKNCKRIIAYMNALYNKYHKVTKKGIPVNVDTSILYGLVQNFYSVKNVNFFMTEGTDFIIFPSDSFSDYFTIKAFYRRKPSGSSEPNELNNNSEILQGLNDDDISGIIEYRTIGNKIRCFFHSDNNLDKKKMICAHYTYQFKDNEYSKMVSKSKNYVFEIRRLSNTNNPNVICQLSLKTTVQNKNDLQIFENFMSKPINYLL